MMPRARNMLCVRSVEQQDLARLAVRRCECGAHHFEGEEAQVPGEYGAANRSQELRSRQGQTILRHHQVLSFNLVYTIIRLFNTLSNLI